MTLPAYAMNQSNFAQMYEGLLVGPLFRPWVDDLLDGARIAPGDRVLDLACGTGIVARLAKERLGNQGRVVAVDLSTQMLDFGRSVDPGIEWREGNAMALPFDETQQFDAIICQQGLQFFPDKPLAAREMRRVLAPGGRLAVAAWRPLEDIPFFLALHRVAERHLGTVVDHRYGFGDPLTLERLLAEAGFKDVRVETVSKTIRFADGAVYLHMNTMALVGMSAMSATCNDEQRVQLCATIAKESIDVLPPYADGEGIAFEVSTNVATARR